MARTISKYLDPLAISKLKNIEVKARFIVEGFITGLHKSPFHGFSVEFSEHRPYNTGEPLRNIDWKVFSKTDKLYTRKYEEETNMRCNVILDISDSMRYPIKDSQSISKLEFGCYLAAALAFLMVKQKDAVGLTLFDEKLNYYMPPKARQSWLIPMFAKLEETVNNAELFTHKTSTAGVLHELAGKLKRRGFIALITDLFSNLHDPQDLFPALQHLRHSKHEVIVFHLLHKETEEDFEFENRPVVLKDLETGEEIKVQPQNIKEEYMKRLLEYKSHLRKKCRELEIELVEVDIKQPYDKVLFDYLIKRYSLTKK